MDQMSRGLRCVGVTAEFRKKTLSHSEEILREVLSSGTQLFPNKRLARDALVTLLIKLPSSYGVIRVGIERLIEWPS